MKKLFSILLIGLALIGLSACSTTNSGASAKKQAPTNESAPAQNADQAGGADKKAN